MFNKNKAKKSLNWITGHYIFLGLNFIHKIKGVTAAAAAAAAAKSLQSCPTLCDPILSRSQISFFDSGTQTPKAFLDHKIISPYIFLQLEAVDFSISILNVEASNRYNVTNLKAITWRRKEKWTQPFIFPGHVFLSHYTLEKMMCEIEKKNHEEASIWKGKCNRVEKKGSEKPLERRESEVCLREENYGQGLSSRPGREALRDIWSALSLRKWIQKISEASFLFVTNTLLELLQNETFNRGAL